MPFSVSSRSGCAKCTLGHCVQYIREQSKGMKDRDTQYRLNQKVGLACTFDQWVPGFSASFMEGRQLDDAINQVVVNALFAGKALEDTKPNHFGKVEKPFFLTAQQIGKVRGDVFQLLSHAILWNACVAGNLSASKRPSFQTPYLPAALSRFSTKAPTVVLTLGDNYDLKKLFAPTAAGVLTAAEAALAVAGTSLCYSTPDLIGVKVPLNNPRLIALSQTPINDLGKQSQDFLNSLRNSFEGHLDPGDIVFAAGLKTSIRSDRMYQLLFEANAWKYIWRMVFSAPPSLYFGLITESYGANPQKLEAVEFSNGSINGGVPTRAIDGLVHVRSPGDLVDWLVRIV